MTDEVQTEQAKMILVPQGANDGLANRQTLRPVMQFVIAAVG